MSVVNRPVRSASSLFKSYILLDRTCIYRSVCSIPKSRCHGGVLPRCLTRNSALCHHWHRVLASACEFRQKRFYSQVFHDESSRSKQNNGESEEDAEEVERDAGISQSESILFTVLGRFSFPHRTATACRMLIIYTIISCFVFSAGPVEGFSLDVLVSLLRQENAVDICVIKVPEQIKYTQYFLVVSGISPRHLRAMALYAVKVVNGNPKHSQYHSQQ